MKLMILDGNSLVNRAFYGVRPLTTLDGLYTNAIYGFLNILQKLLGEEDPDALCVAFDLKGPTFRHEMYDAYKGTRKGMPEELAQQMPVLKQVLTAMNIPMFTAQGWEADDILGTAARICEEQDWQCVVVTGDRDSLQLITEKTTVKWISTKGGQTTTTNYSPALFAEEYGFQPPILIDLKGLMGDSSDNIPGVPGVGEKTAKALLAQFGTLKGVYEHLDSKEIKDSVRKKLDAGRDSADLSYQLATIRRDAPIDFVPGSLLRQPVDNDALYALFVRLEFLRLIDRWGLHRPGTQQETAGPAEEAPAPVASGTLPGVHEEAAILLEGETFSAASASASFTGAIAENRQWLQDWLAGDQVKIFHDYKAQLRLLHSLGLEVCETGVFDTALAAYVLNAAWADYAVPRLAMAYLSESCEGMPQEQLAVRVFRLKAPLEKAMEDQGVTGLYREVDLPLCRVLAGMEETGVLVDRAALEAFGKMVSEKSEACRRRVYEAAGVEFNINSPKQLGEILFERLQLPGGKKSSRGWSTSADVLEKLRPIHPVVQEILDYRTYAKMNATYAEGLQKAIEPDGRIRTTFQNMVTATGRLSSTDPNLQNIPVRTELGSEIRKMFVPAPGCVYVDADYSQIELRVLAHIADDKLMQQAFLSGEDIHRVTASQVFGVPPEDVTAQMRRSAKAVNFGIVYGISEFSLAEDIGVSRREAKAYIDGYLEKYSGVRAYMHDIVAQGREQGYVSTMYGRRRQLPDLRSSNFNVRSASERIAMNTPIQGTAADIIKMAMVSVDRAIRDRGLRAKLVLQIHDELIVECPAEERDTVLQLLEEKMEQVAELRVPLLAEAKAGESWYAAK